MKKILENSIRVAEGMPYINVKEPKKILKLALPSEDDLPECHYGFNNGVYIFRYGGELYMARNLASKNLPFPPNFRYKGVGVPMSSGKRKFVGNERANRVLNF